MEVTLRRRFVVEDASHAGVVRRDASALAARLGAGTEEAGRVALVVTEAATNLVKHAGGGEILVYGGRDDGGWTMRMLAVDRGPGMRNVAACLEDGVSSAGSPGFGMGVMRRGATAFDLHTSPSGTVVFAEFRADGRPARRSGFATGAVRVPYPGEEACGDDWAIVPVGDGRCMVLVVDGLGHGLGAATAAEEATRLFRTRPTGAPGDALAALHAGLRGTRGAAAAVALLDARSRTVRFAGVGNVAGCVCDDGRAQSMVSLHGTLGHQVQRIQEFDYAWPERGLVVLHSDGVSARWTLDGYPGLGARHPMVVAAVLYRDHGRRTDDASVVVVGEAA